MAGAISDPALFHRAASWGATVHASQGAAFDWSGEQTLEVIAQSVKTKATVVTADPLEKGRRAILNAGHTVAHALERESNYALLHGEAVAIGLVGVRTPHGVARNAFDAAFVPGGSSSGSGVAVGAGSPRPSRRITL